MKQTQYLFSTQEFQYVGPVGTLHLFNPWMDGLGMWTDGGSVDEWVDGWTER